MDAFYGIWARAVPGALAKANLAWRRPLRRLTWLRTLSWMARWRASAEASVGTTLPADLRDHVRRRIDDFLDPETIDRVRNDLSAPGSP